MSLLEAVTNVVVGYVVAVLTQLLLFPVFGLHVAVKENLAIAGVFTVVSIMRSYLLRRLFEGVRARAQT
jgi:hypothetical protein